MPETADPAASRCSSLFSGTGIEEFQRLRPDLSSPRARDARGRFATGHSGNPRGRPKGIPNPRRRVPDLIARRLGPAALSDFLERKPHLLAALAAQLLPPVAAAALAAVARGELAPAEARRLARRVGARLRAIRRLERLRRGVGRGLDGGGPFAR